MKYIKKLWSRVLISLLCGSAFSEIFSLSSGNTNQPTLLYIALIFILLSVIAYIDIVRHYFFGSKEEEQGREDILDD